MASPLCDPLAEAVLDRLHALSERQLVLMRHSRLRRLWEDQILRKKRAEPAAFLRDKLVALDREKCHLCYLLCRALGARRVVEAGTSFGVSTIYLAAAVRDNVLAMGGTGVVIGTENEPSKAAAARANLEQAGLLDYVELREGDMRESLKDAGGPVDFMLIDTWIPMTRPTLEIVSPQLRRGAIVLCDNVGSLAHAYRDYIAYVRDPANGFRSLLLPDQGGVEMSVRVA